MMEDELAVEFDEFYVLSVEPPVAQPRQIIKLATAIANKYFFIMISIPGLSLVQFLILMDVRFYLDFDGPVNNPLPLEPAGQRTVARRDDRNASYFVTYSDLEQPEFQFGT